MKKRILGSIVFGLLLVVFQLGALSPAELKLEGSTTVLPIAGRAAELFQALYPEISVTVKGGGSSVGITALINGTTDIAMASRAMKPAELVKLPTAFEHMIAKDGIAIVVHPSNTIEGLTLQQIADIYTDTSIRNWRELGGPNLPIVVVSRDTTSGTYGSFMEIVIEQVKGKGAQLRPDTIYVSSNAEAVATVKDAEGAIAYIGIGYLKEGLKPLPIAKDSGPYISASAETVLSGSYPISRDLYMYTNGVPDQREPRGLWLDFIYSRTGQCVVQEQGFVALYRLELAACEALFAALGTEFISR